MTIQDLTSPETYETVKGDPINVKIHTLANGLKIYMSVNKDEPRIQTNIAVRAGSKHDPAETTGLAHYLEHMLFKGTNKIGALDWEQEKIYLEKISDLYERHRAEKDPEKRKGIYAQIDQLSSLAAELVAANEYDKMASALGAKGTNAYTWVEQTVYINDIPSNELERWMQLESERFRMCVLRLFHTELEAVYEEYNINQDRDFRKVSQAVNETLFPSHPYGTQTTIGKGEHLKNPSHVKIQEYFSKYYVPNNMAIVLSGDFDPDQVVKMAEKYFGDYITKSVEPFQYDEQPVMEKVVTKEVFGQEAAWMEMSWAFPGANTKEAMYLDLVRGILYNRQAGLIDLNILQQQKMLEARASTTKMEDYSIFKLYGKPREKQTLDDVQTLLLAELANVKAGNFDEDLIAAVVKDFKLSEIRNNESNNARAYFMTSAFILGIDWKDYVERYDEMAKITKDELVAFANRFFGDNYVAVFKRTGEDESVAKVEKPAITPISLNREEASEFTEAFLANQAESLAPTFLDYEALIQNQTLSSGIELDYIHNTSNPLFSMDLILDMGRNNDQYMALAIAYLPYLGTSKYSPEALQKEFFRLGLSFDVTTTSDRMYVSLSGLDESFAEGVALFEHILADVQGNQEALDNVVKDIM
ncbi:MAG: pitrilysin family protein, partial [Bacteroidota bacterium]